MTQTIGVLMMAAPLLWLLFRVFSALRESSLLIEFDIAEIVVSVALFAAGRIVAGQSMISILLN